VRRRTFIPGSSAASTPLHLSADDAYIAMVRRLQCPRCRTSLVWVASTDLRRFEVAARGGRRHWIAYFDLTCRACGKVSMLRGDASFIPDDEAAQVRGNEQVRIREAIEAAYLEDD
jgi:uncharacterized protein YbaR (Trm112 family)